MLGVTGGDIVGRQQNIVVLVSERFIAVANRMHEHFKECNGRGQNPGFTTVDGLKERTENIDIRRMFPD